MGISRIQFSSTVSGGSSPSETVLLGSCSATCCCSGNAFLGGWGVITFLGGWEAIAFVEDSEGLERFLIFSFTSSTLAFTWEEATTRVVSNFSCKSSLLATHVAATLEAAAPKPIFPASFQLSCVSNPKTRPQAKEVVHKYINCLAFIDSILRS